MPKMAVKRSFFFPARVGQVPHYAMQILAAMGDGFDDSLVVAAISETLLNAIIHGALGIESGEDRDPVEFADAIAEAESRTGPNVGLKVKVYPDEEDSYDVLVRIEDPGDGFDWRKRLDALADVNVSIENQDLLSTSGRGISIALAGARAVLWNEVGNVVTLRFRPRSAPKAVSHPPPPIVIVPPPDIRQAPDSSDPASTRGAPSTENIQFARTQPLKSQPQAKSSSGSPKRRSSGNLPQAGARVLVVDDIEINCRVLQRMLEWDGYEVRTASDGASAIEVVEQWRPDVVIMDVNMPRMSGIEAVRVMQKRKLLSDTEVMLLTAADVDGDLRSEGLEAGACDFLEKPISRRELIARVRRRVETLRDRHAVEEERDGIRESVDAASQVMEALMPDPVVLVPEARIQSLVLPCQAIGGDVITVIELAEGGWVVLLVDVAGHGIAAALTASAARAVLQEKLSERRGLATAVEALNRQLSYDFDRTGQQAAISGMCFDSETRELHVLNAGNPPVVVWRRDGSRSLVKSSAPPAGLVEGMTFDETVFPAEQMQRVVIVSDGITESVGASSDTVGALETLTGHPPEAFESIPEKELKQAVADMGPDRDDVSVAWIDFSVWQGGNV